MMAEVEYNPSDGAADILLKAEGLSHAYDYPLYNDVDVTLRAGESTAIQGRSGSGKSTLLHTLSGFLPPLSGRVEVLGRSLYAMSEAERDRFRREKLGIVFQTHYLFKGMTGRQNIEAATLLSGTRIDPWLLERLEIADVIDQKVSELSGGQQQRVSVARVLAKTPIVIFADEPTGNLDKQTAALVIDVLQEYVRKNRAALFVVTHDAAVAQRCEHHFVLEDKRLLPI
jgi:putative ABC transport system ATP-binding protein